MLFLVDNNLKVIFGWSAKCGCSHVKRIFFFLQNDKIDNIIHRGGEKFVLPDDIENYTTILFCRNPYKRIISGFLDKYKINGEFRHLWKHYYITFSQFINELMKNKWEMIEKHHFTPQTSEDFDKNKIKMSKCVKCFDIENIDYTYIEGLYNKSLPLELLSKKEGHERKKYQETYNGPVYNLYMYTYYNYNVDVKYFYNEDLKNKVYKFYENDFLFFNELGINYKMP